MSMADRARMDGLEERLVALEVAKFKERIDFIDMRLSAMKEAGAVGWMGGKVGKESIALENEVEVLRARIKKLEETI